ncbi:hypothetical protein BK379_18500 [Escherichia coli]|nr:hypothetical protein BK379_18500 [Escherichia coli]
MVRRLRFSGPKTSIICSPMTSLKTSIKTITYLSDTGCLEIQGATSFMLTIFLTFPETDSTPLVNSVMKPLHAAKIDRQEKSKSSEKL